VASNNINSKLQTLLSYGYPRVPKCLDKRGSHVLLLLVFRDKMFNFGNKRNEKKSVIDITIFHNV